MYRKKKKKLNKQIMVISILVLTFIIGVIINIFNTDRKLTIFEKAIKDSIMSINKVISYPFSLIVKNGDITNNEEIKNLQNQNDELFYQIKELKDVLELNKSLIDYETINATIINRDLSYWQDTIVIDKGEYHGLTVGMPITVKNGLIGKIISTTTFSSTVRLITANNSNDKISVKIKIDDNYVYGILSNYDSKKDVYIITGVAQNIEMKDNLIVTTTGMSDNFPSGIVIGRVIGITTDAFDLAKVLEIKSDVNFDNINYVTALKRNI